MSTIDELKQGIADAQAQLLAAGKKGDLDGMREAMSAVSKAEAELRRAETEAQRAENAARQKVIAEAAAEAKAIIEAAIKGNPEPFTKAYNAGLKNFWVHAHEETGSWLIDVSQRTVSATRTPRAKKEGEAAPATGAGRHVIIPADDPSLQLTSREFLTRLAGQGNEEAQAALDKIEQAKAENKPSPGFDAAVKRLIGQGLGAFA